MSKKILLYFIGTLVISFLVTNTLMYYSNYKNALEAAGIEAYGCANITTGLINQSDLLLALQGSEGGQKNLTDELSWTKEHKKIFRNQYILNLDGEVIATDKFFEDFGIKIGDNHPIDKELLETIKSGKPTYSKVYDINGHPTLTGFAPVFANHDASQKVIAINAIDFDGDIVKERTVENIAVSLFGNLIPIVLIFFIFFIKVINPLRMVSEKVKRIAEGDLTAEIEFKTEDEISELAKDINSLTKRFRSIV